MRRTNRQDIFDNFEDPQQVADLVALIATMPGCKLTVRRSRRRPMHLLRWHADRPSGLTPQESLANLLRLRDLFPRDDPDFVGLDKLHPVGGGWWLSPAQRGRQNGKKRAGFGVWQSTLNLWSDRLFNIEPGPPLTMSGILATLERQVARDEAMRRSPPPLLISPAQLRDYNLLGVVSAVDAETGTITLSTPNPVAYRITQAPLPKPSPAGWSRRPAFIPVRRLDGRR